jgi:hypothetical protein
MAWPLLIIVGMGAGLALVMTANSVFYGILEQVNSMSPADRQFDKWARTEFFEILEHHRILFPHSALRTRMWSFTAAGFSLFLLTPIAGLLHYSAVGK